MISNGKKAAIHIAKSQLGLSKKEYRAELLACVGVSSSLDLDQEMFAKTMRHFKALGYVSNANDFREIDNLPPQDRKVMSKINAIRLDLGKKWKWVDGIAKRQIGVEKVQWVKGEDLFKILQALVIHQNRHKKKPAKEA